jgi:hypothetical protein
LKDIYLLVRSNIEDAYKTTSHYYNLRRRNVFFKVGQLVLRKNYVLSSAAQKISAGLMPKFLGPFRITRQISPLTYELVTTNGKPAGRWHIKVMRRLREHVRRKRPALCVSNDWLFHHDNAPAHAALSVQWFPARNKTTVVPHPHYSPDLAPSDFLPSPKIKMKLKAGVSMMWRKFKQNRRPHFTPFRKKSSRNVPISGRVGIVV